MGRRFKRFNRLRQQLVEVTRRIWKTCICCGGIREETRKDLVPLAAVISGTAAMRPRPVRVGNSVGNCCNPLVQDSSWMRHREEEWCFERSIGPAESACFYVNEQNFGKSNCSPRRRKTPGRDVPTVSGEVNSKSSEGPWSAEMQSLNESIGSQSSVSPPLPLRPFPVTLYKHPHDSVPKGHVPVRYSCTRMEVSNRPRYEPTPLSLSGNVTSVVLNAVEGIDSGADSTVLPFTNTPGKLNQKPGLTLDLSEIVSPRVVSPPELRVEFACDEFWYRTRPYDWTVQRNISRHHRSEVNIITLQQRQEAFALKTLNSETSLTESVLLMDCQSPFVVKMCASFVLGDERYICMIYYKNRDLAHWMRKDRSRKYFSEHEAVWICAYILASLDFLHSQSILHLDIHPGNILIDDKGYPVLGDFGCAVDLASLKKINGYTKITPAYACPEVHSSFPPVKLWDLWSVACIFYEIITDRSPWQGKNRAETELRASLVLTPDVSMLSPIAQNFVISQLKPTVSERLGFSTGAREVMRHRIFGDVDWARVKYGHRHDHSPLLDILHKLQGPEEVLPTNIATESADLASSSCQNDNDWELWSSSSSDEEPSEEYNFSACVQRKLFTVFEEEEEEEEKDDDDDDETNGRP